MDTKPFSEVIYEEYPFRVVRVGNWRRIFRIDNNYGMWIFDKPTQDVVDQFLAQTENEK